MLVEAKSPMVVVANRLPFLVGRNAETGELERRPCAGGLVTAVAPVVVETGGLWVGWTGSHIPVQSMPEADPNDMSPTAGLKSEQVIPVAVPKNQFDDYYNGCCNACFWPLFHSMPCRAVFQGDKWDAYRSVNEEFAHLTVGAVRRLIQKRPDAIPLVWIHDYHLMLASNYIRTACDQEGLQIKMAFFLHIPFPSWDVMRLFPWDDELLQGILGCDTIGFHVEDYCLNFIDCCHRRLGYRVDRVEKLVEHGHRTVSVHALPISIPYDRFVALAEKAPVVIKNPDKEQMLLGIDRLDYTKGLIHRLRAFEVLLEKYPQHIERVSFLQVAVPSRTDVKEYQDLKEEIDQMIGKVNGRFSTPNWSPIRYIYGYVPQDQLAAFYRDASVAIVTPLRDGMNLVAKEFVACQTKDPGVLLLSPFAGAGSTMHEALLVNPYETTEFADMINRALVMPKDERELRMTQLRKRERANDVNVWLEAFLRSVDCLVTDTPAPNHIMPSTNDYSQFLSTCVTEYTHLALLLDYDGTLAPIAPHPDLAYMPEETRRVLERLTNLPDVNIAIISGRSLENVRKMVGIDNITYAGSHGIEILHPDGTHFNHPIPHEYESQLEYLKNDLSQVCVEGAWVEDKGHSVTFHYRKVPKDKIPQVTKAAKEIFEKNNIHPYVAHKAYEARPPVTWDKGRAAIYILRTLFGVDWNDRITTIFMGDDKTDEDAMKALQGMATTFRVTGTDNIRTAANYRLPSTDAVLNMLKWIENRLGSRSPLQNGNRLRRSDSTSTPRNHSPSKSPTRSSPENIVASMTLSEEDYKTMLTKRSSISTPTKELERGFLINGK